MSGKTHKNWGGKKPCPVSARVAPVSVGKDKNRKNPLCRMQNVSYEPWTL